MDRDAAEKLSGLMIEFGARLNESVALVQQKGSPSEFEAYRAAVGVILGEMLLSIMNPIYKEYPELKPPELE